MRLGRQHVLPHERVAVRRYTLESLLERVAELGLGPGLEVIGFQTWRDYPDARPRGRPRLPPALRAARARACGHRRLRRPRFAASGGAMTVEPSASRRSRTQIDARRRSRVPVIRLHVGVPVPAIERPRLRRSAPASSLRPSSRAGRRPTTVARRCSSSASASGRRSVALVLDFSIAMRAIPTTFADAVRSPAWRAATSIGSSSCGATARLSRELFAAIAEVGAPARPRRGALGVRPLRPTGSRRLGAARAPGRARAREVLGARRDG